MNKISKILSDIERPLLFAAKNDFKNIGKLTGTAQYIAQMRIKAISLKVDNKTEKVLSEIESSFNQFESKSKGEQKEIVSSSLKLINDLKENIVSKPDPAVTKKEQPAKVQSNIKSDSPVQYIKGVGPKISQMLERKGISSVNDILYYFPRRYEDRRNLNTISDISQDEPTTVIGKIELSGVVKIRTRSIYKIVISDGTGFANLIWFQFHKSYLSKLYKKGLYAVVSGVFTYDKYSGAFQLIHPKPEDIEVVETKEELEQDSTNFNRIVPVYHLTEGLKQKRIRNIVRNVLDQDFDISDPIPSSVRDKHSLLGLKDAMSRVHFPLAEDTVVDLENGEHIQKSRPHFTVAYFELFMLQLGLALKRKKLDEVDGISFKNDNNMPRELLGNLKFALTGAQKRVIKEIYKDLDSEKQMNRLLQGDVGSGKTIVALLSILKVIESGYQAVFMAPTEILSEQHYKNLTSYLKDFDLNIVLLKSAITRAARTEVLESIKDGSANIIIGTHAVFQKDVDYKKLGLVVIDEQHRFGVAQRSDLIKKGLTPDVLIMTATPIPRTLSMAYFGDLDISVIDEMPKDRKKIATKVYYNDEKNRQRAYDVVAAELKAGRQAYIVAPMIEESENTDFKHLKYVNDLADELSEGYLSGFKLEALHGQMKSEQKDEIMTSFLGKQIDVLVATSVIEVGIDVPNASVIVIENAERFGLSQLHQLRGRVGRGEFQSKCLLVSSYKRSELAGKRLSVLEQTNDGFKIAETDLLIRGPGEFIGTRQSGIPELKFANIIRDTAILRLAKMDAFELIDNCESEEQLKNYTKMLQEKWGESLEFASVS
ncbi:MAG TPA: ATP-dependent DNA helicase RecG [Thermodesulfobacteriota bacterium]|nr:ATP-dependent DNA helicase RecG [Thermodesulfobacteriota bacterium]